MLMSFPPRVVSLRPVAIDPVSIVPQLQKRSAANSYTHVNCCVIQSFQKHFPDSDRKEWETTVQQTNKNGTKGGNR